MFGYGSNVTSPANFRKSGELSNGSQDTSFDGEPSDGLKCIFKTSNTSPGPLKLKRNSIGDSPSPLKLHQQRNSAGNIETYTSTYSSFENVKSSSERKQSSENNNNLNCVYQSSENKPFRDSSSGASQSDAHFKPISKRSRYVSLNKIYYLNFSG